MIISSKILKSTLILLLISASNFSTGQQTQSLPLKAPGPIIPSANALNLGLFGEMQVSLFSGLPQINVPIYNLTAGPISIPISLNYHASGVRPKVHPSWVGLGWSLNAGGSITRIKKGFSDEQGTVQHGQTWVFEHFKGYYYSHAVNTPSTWSSSSYLSDYRANDLLTDFSPDEFMFSFPGHSGKIFLDDLGAWQVQCDKPVKVKFVSCDLTPFVTGRTGYKDALSNTFKIFILVDENGIEYTFGETESAIEYSDILTPSTGEQFKASSWQLTKIKSADGVDEFFFNYVRGPFQSTIYSYISGRIINGSNGGSWNPACYNWNNQISYGAKLISPVYLQSIEHKRQNLKIEFLTSASNELSYTDANYEKVTGDPTDDINFAGVLDEYARIPFYTTSNPISTSRKDRFIWLKLDAIKIINTSHTAVKLKSVVFNYNAGSNNGTERLMLQSVDFKNTADAGIQAYSFVYDNQSLPGYMATEGDHWGFNNNSAAYNLINDFTYASKNPDFNYAKAGILKEITYPTGGKTFLEYELNTYSRAVNGNDRSIIDNVSGTAGGLRVKTIKSIDNVGHEELKSYFYVTGYNSTVSNPASLPSSGVLDVVPKYQFGPISAIDASNIGFTYSLLSSNPIIPLTLTSTGQHIGYSEVVEKRSDGAYTIYNYTNHDVLGESHTDVYPIAVFNRDLTPYIPHSSRDFERGRLLSKIMYANNDKPIQSEVYEYERLGNVNTQSVRCIQQDYSAVCSESPLRMYVCRAAYVLYYYPFVVKKLTTKNYQTGSGNSYLSNVQEFTYDNKLLKTTIQTDSKGQQLKTENFYPANITSTVHATMVSKNMVAYPVQINQYRASQLLKSTNIDYKSWFNGGIYPEYSKEQIAGGSVQVNMQINQYDSKGNIIQLTSRNGIKESYIWDYKEFHNTAKVTNAVATDIAYTSFESHDTYHHGNWDFNGLPTPDYTAPTGNKVYAISSNKDIQKTNLDDTKTFIVSYWSKNGALDVNGYSATSGRTISGYTYYEHIVPTPAGGIITVSGTATIDELRLYPKGALMTTYTYEPLVGMTSQCDPGSRITYYEYDGIGRLILIRDHDKNITKKLCYNYEGHTEDCNINYYFNDQKSKTITMGCGTSVTYTVSANAYRSTISAAHANQLAQADVDANTQIYGDIYFPCVYYSLDWVFYDFYEDAYTYWEELDFTIHFWEDAAWTVPLTLTSNYNVPFERWYWGPGWASIVPDIAYALAGNSLYSIGPITTYYIDPYTENHADIRLQ